MASNNVNNNLSNILFYDNLVHAMKTPFYPLFKSEKKKFSPCSLLCKFKVVRNLPIKIWVQYYSTETICTAVL